MTGPASRNCKVCGCALRHDNKSGICHGRGKPECQAARGRYIHERALVKNGISIEPRYCAVCGGLLRHDNTTGLCKRTPECVRERGARRRRGPAQQPKQCSHPDGCPNPARTNGVCNMHALRIRATGELGPAGPKYHPIVISAGDVFGQWTTLEDYVWTDGKILCRCECGRVKRTGAKALTIGTSRSCGHRSGRREFRKAAIVQPGDIFNYLTVLEAGYLYGDLVAVHCECGRTKKKMAGMVRDGKVKSCGCGKGKFIHGYSRHPLYGIWRGIIGRCTDPNNAAWPKYGGDPRGITVCQGYRGAPDGLLALAADLGPRPSRAHSVDRRNNDKGYLCGRCEECKRNGWPPNCRWATRREQNENQRKIAALTRDLAARDATIGGLAAEVDRLTALLATRKPTEPRRELAEMEPLF